MPVDCPKYNVLEKTNSIGILLWAQTIYCLEKLKCKLIKLTADWIKWVSKIWNTN